jgi:predicted GNAT family acetyltransferase
MTCVERPVGHGFVAVRDDGPMADVEIKNNPEQNRYEAWLGGELAGFAEYELRDDETIVFVHTVVEDEYEGEGVGSTLVRETLDDVQRDGELGVVVKCSFIKEWIKRHPDYEHLLA